MKTFKEIFIGNWRKSKGYKKEDEERFNMDVIQDEGFQIIAVAAEEYKDQFICACKKEEIKKDTTQTELSHHQV